MRWSLHKVRKAKIDTKLRDLFEQAGVATVQTFAFSALANREGMPVELRDISVAQSKERTAAIKWLTEKADMAERKEQRVEFVEWAILAFVILGVITDVMLVLHERS
jgi:hypothetical protein